ncbi:MAG: hypothetical protein JO100_13785 [Pseudonocardia sp.]|nr:hypothetical protein [Pseudonocardia sp.]
MHAISPRRITAAAARRCDFILAAVVILTTLGIAPGSAAAEPRPQPTGYAISGVDTAEWQHDNGAAIDWSKVRAAGIKFATVKATRGVNIADPYLKTDLEAARTAGLAVAPYHFYTGTEPNTGAAQADRFIAAVKNIGYTGHRPGDLPPVFDLEWVDVDPNKGKCPSHVSADDAKAWLDKVQAAFDRQPIIYTQKRFLDECMGSTTAFAQYKLQLADYRQSITEPPLPNGSTTWTIWQYAGDASRDGIRSKVPADVFNGTQSDLDALANR